MAREGEQIGGERKAAVEAQSLTAIWAEVTVARP